MSYDDNATPITTAEYEAEHEIDGEYWDEARAYIWDEATRDFLPAPPLTAWADESDLERFADSLDAEAEENYGYRVIDGLDSARAYRDRKIAELPGRLTAARASRYGHDMSHILREHLDAVWHRITHDEVPGIISLYATDVTVEDHRNIGCSTWRFTIHGDSYSIFDHRNHACRALISIDYIDPALEGFSW
ncbi:hypothetical protein [Tsukamurella paurometabola]|uniref:SnoaL-like domain-containing protein n=1 Tax=Tsukamurella paurometabola TaxID=2061 RepID=A0ABS5NJ93_TSUPA|nr:hypothetical protein [Tsukamurella paurometabola]MBS4104375.1 hypothetical protein [Tsukamurella paurometabola]